MYVKDLMQGLEINALVGPIKCLPMEVLLYYFEKYIF